MKRVAGAMLASLLLFASCRQAPPAAPPATGEPPKTLKVGVTLHPYYSWVASIAAGLPIEVVAVLPGEVDAGSYQPSPEDIGKLSDLDAIVVNGIGHDDFIPDMVRASGNERIVTIDANEGTPTIPGLHGEGRNSHTFLSFTHAIAQTKHIAGRLAGLRPDLAGALGKNAQEYTARLDAIRAEASAKLSGAKVRRVVTVHDGYSYLLSELGIDLAGVVEPAHGLVPSAKELAEMIGLIEKEKIRVVLTEESFPERLLQTLRESTSARVYVISHIAMGDYSADEFERGMKANADVLVRALVTDPS